MIDLNKSLEYFNPNDVDGVINIIGCGAVGSHVAVLLARLGFTNFILWDDDTVSSHNIANQNFTFNDIGRSKTEVVSEVIKAINPECRVITNGRVEEHTYLTGSIVVCVDSIAVRKMIANICTLGSPWNRVFDFRMGLTSGQFYCVDTLDKLQMWTKTMNFTDEEADALTPRTACGFELSVAYSIWAMLGIGMSLMVRSWKGETLPLTTIIDCGNLSVLTT